MNRKATLMRMQCAAEAECVLCGADAVRAVLLQATMLNENDDDWTTFVEHVCVPCVMAQQKLREEAFR